MKQSDRHTALHQAPSSDISIATVVARAAQDDGTHSSGMETQKRRRHPRACLLHEAETVDTRGRSSGINGSHFGGQKKKVGEMLVHPGIQSETA
jgi:hypothetical protein